MRFLFYPQILVLTAVATIWPAYLAGETEVSRTLLGLTNDMASRLDKASQCGAIELAPVNLPVDPPGDCNHYGWPVATMVDDTLLVMHRRIPGHRAQGAGKADDGMSYGIVLRSDDGGKTWSSPYDLRQSMRPEDRDRGGVVPLSHRFKFAPGNRSTKGYKIHLHAMGTTRNGGVIAINNHGVFRTDDRGITWRHYPEALRDDTFPYPIVNIGPRILDHPDEGLLVFGNWFGSAAGPAKSDQFVVLRSRDGGKHWTVKSHDVGFHQYEPSVLLHQGEFLLVTRDQTSGCEHQQMTWLPGEDPRVLATNLKDPRYVDTADLCFNPRTGRLELIRSERFRMELWLWSMDPADWQLGNWRRECCLLARDGEFYKTADGFHPAGAVVDEQRRVQHIFVYVGHPNGPAGVFRITRTLDTPKLIHLLNPDFSKTSP